MFAWVLMPEHVHLLCCPGDGETLGHSLRLIKMSVAKAVLARWAALDAPILGRVADAVGRHRFWQKGGGFDRNVRSDGEFEREVRYIHRNPVERGLVPRPEDWRWSSVHWWMGVGRVWSSGAIRRRATRERGLPGVASCECPSMCAVRHRSSAAGLRWHGADSL